MHLPLSVTHLLSTDCLPGVMCGVGLGPKTVTPHEVHQRNAQLILHVQFPLPGLSSLPPPP